MQSEEPLAAIWKNPPKAGVFHFAAFYRCHRFVSSNGIEASGPAWKMRQNDRRLYVISQIRWAMTVEEEYWNWIKNRGKRHYDEGENHAEGHIEDQTVGFAVVGDG
jgi:hypothetical protein